MVSFKIIVVALKFFKLIFFSYDCPAENKSVFHNSAQLTEEAFQENPIINWDAILWVKRPLELWAMELFLALISLTKALLVAYLGYKVLDITIIQYLEK